MIWDRDVPDQRFEQPLAPRRRKVLKDGRKPDSGDQFPHLDAFERNLAIRTVARNGDGVSLLTIERDSKFPERREAAWAGGGRPLARGRGGNRYGPVARLVRQRPGDTLRFERFEHVLLASDTHGSGRGRPVELERSARPRILR